MSGFVYDGLLGVMLRELIQGGVDDQITLNRLTAPRAALIYWSGF